jgi:fumarate hydratase class II
MPREIITTYAILKRSAAIANHKGGWLDDEPYDLGIATDSKSNVFVAENRGRRIHKFRVIQ